MAFELVVDPIVVHRPVDAAMALAYLAFFGAAFRLASVRPAWGVALLIACVPFDVARDAGPTTITLAKVALLGVAAALAVARTPLAPLRAAPAAWAGGAAVAVALATALSIAQADFVLPAVRETLKAAQYALLFGTVVVAVTRDPDEFPVRAGLTATVALVSALALTEEVTGAPSGLWLLGHVVPRIAGPLEGPNQLAGYLGIALPVLIALTLRRRSRPVDLAVVLAACALVLTLSRSGVLATLLGIAVVIALAPAVARRRGAALALLAAGVLGGVAILGLWTFTIGHSLAAIDGTFGRFGSFAEVERPGGVGKRSELWRAALALWRTHPFLGIGAGNFELEIGRVGPAGVRTHANSLYLQALVEGGVPLFAATVGAVVAALAALRRGPFDEPLVLGALGAVCGLAVHQVVDTLMFYPKVGDFWWIVVAAGVARASRRTAVATPI